MVVHASRKRWRSRGKKIMNLRPSRAGSGLRSSYSEKTGFRTSGREQLRKTPSADIRPLHACIPLHTHVTHVTHIHTDWCTIDICSLSLSPQVHAVFHRYGFLQEMSSSDLSFPQILTWLPSKTLLTFLPPIQVSTASSSCTVCYFLYVKLRFHRWPLMLLSIQWLCNVMVESPVPPEVQLKPKSPSLCPGEPHQSLQAFVFSHIRWG